MTVPSWTTRRTFRAALVVLVAGIAMLAVARGTTAHVVGGTLLGIAAVLLISFAFLLVGESEDRDRRRHPHG